MKINHKTIVQQQNNPSYEVSRNAWNAAHDMIVGAAKLVGNSTASTGSAEEISVGANLTLAAGVLSAASAPVAFGSIKVTTFTSSGTYTPDANLVAGYAVVKGGGGGGNTMSVNPSLDYGAGGGGEGATAIKFFTAADVAGGVSVTIGAGGGAADGSASSFGALATAAPGKGATGFNGGLGGSRALSTGDILIAGAPGGNGMLISGDGAVATGGPGGGAGGAQGTATTATPAFTVGNIAEANTGGGGSGGSSRAAGPGSVGGGTGGSGFVYVVEFLSA